MNTALTLSNETTAEEEAKCLEQVKTSEDINELNLSPSALKKKFSDLKHGRDSWKNANKAKRIELQAIRTRLNEVRASRESWRNLYLDLKSQNKELLKAHENEIKNAKSSLENEWKESLDMISKKKEEIKKKLEEELIEEYELKMAMELKTREDDLKKKVKSSKN